MDAYLGIDVGTASARAGLFDAHGRLLAAARHPLRIWRDGAGRAEQSSTDIWRAVCAAVRGALAKADLSSEAVKGVGFAATCSLVVVGPRGRGLAVGPEDDGDRDVVMWMDHRAGSQAERINRTGAAPLRYVGGGVSVEMQMPKLLWLKEHRLRTFEAAEHFFDLPDYLSWRATGSSARSVCTLTCKWNYLPHDGGWSLDFLDRIGLHELSDGNYRRIGSDVLPVGCRVGSGLSETAAAELGLVAGTPVAASLIDAHAGAMGTLDRVGADDRDGTIALIMGTSACAMAVTEAPVFADGIWGPYRDALVPGAWMLEGGQSAFGAAIDTLVACHPGYHALQSRLGTNGQAVLDELEADALRSGGTLEASAQLGERLTVVPDVLGRRSPQPDPSATAAIAGLTFGNDAGQLAGFYAAILRGLCYGADDIVRSLRASGVPIRRMVVSGGAARSPLLRRILADATGLRIALPETAEPVLLGGALIASLAAGRHRGVAEAAAAMVRSLPEIEPDLDAAEFHELGKRAYHILQDAERRIRTAGTKPPTLDQAWARTDSA